MSQQEPAWTASAGPGSSATAKPGRTRHVDKVSPPAEVEDSPYFLYHVTVAPICATVNVNGANLTIEVDTGASLSLISHNMLHCHILQLVAIQHTITTANREGPEHLCR